MAYWSETIIRINNSLNFRWEIVSLDEEMVTLRYQELEEKEWVTKQEVEMTLEVAQIIFKSEFVPKVVDHEPSIYGA